MGYFRVPTKPRRREVRPQGARAIARRPSDLKQYYEPKVRRFPGNPHLLRPERAPFGDRPGVARPGKIPLAPSAIPPAMRRRFIPPMWSIPPGIAIPLGAGDWLDEWWQHWKNPEPYGLPGPWTLYHDCGRSPGNPPYAVPGVHVTVAHEFRFFTSEIPKCLAGQARGTTIRQVWTPSQGYITDPAAISGSYDEAVLQDTRQAIGTGLVGSRHDKHYHAPSNQTGFKPTVRPSLAWPWDPLKDPNVERGLPGEPSPAWPEPPPVEVPPAWSWSDAPPGTSPPRAHERTPPRPNQREAKFRSRAARLGVFLWNLMDTVSELTEIMGALYKGLPPEVRAKAGCAKGINIGQYGSDFNRCMAETLWKNWHKLDGATAFKEIAKNVAEDMTVGQFHRWLDKVTPPGISIEKTALTSALAPAQLEAYIADRLNALFEALGL